MSALALPALLLVSSVAAAAQDPTGPPPMAREVYPLRGILGPLLRTALPPMTSFLQVRSWQEPGDQIAGVQEDRIEGLLRSVYRADLEAGRLQLSAW